MRAWRIATNELVYATTASGMAKNKGVAKVLQLMGKGETNQSEIAYFNSCKGRASNHIFLLAKDPWP
jgi:hypothetical protein